ncbi:class I SAM-dependent methyltransferase [Streptomyces sp. NPDC002580]|uniref:class I SAM-dependent methyltransferase n=1 Tax=Streptomyces sp. NPDC002580 TaxID=3364653 RepID=UPI0036CB2889
MSTTREDWDRSYADGRRYSPLRDAERTLLDLLGPPPDGGRALDVGCGTGELAAHLSSTGYAVDAVDWSETALAEAGARYGETARRLHLDVESDDWTPPNDGYGLITLRPVVPFLTSRDRTLRALGRRLRHGGALVVITPLAADTPAERRGVALDEDEIAALRHGRSSTERHDADGLAFLVLRGPRQDDTAPRTTKARLSSPDDVGIPGKGCGGRSSTPSPG